MWKVCTGSEAGKDPQCVYMWVSSQHVFYDVINTEDHGYKRGLSCSNSVFALILRI